MEEQATQGQVEQAQPVPIAQTEIPIHEATVEQLDQFLAYSEANEPPEQDEPEEQEVEEPTQEVVEEPKEAAPTPEAAPTEPTEEKKPGVTPEALKQFVDSQTQAASTAVGQIAQAREQLTAANAKLEESLKEELQDNPSAVVDAKLQIRANTEALSKLAGQEQQIRSRHSSVVTVAQKLSPEQFDVAAMSSSLERDGATATQIAQFKQDPFSFADGPGLINLAKRAHAERLVADVVPYIRQLEAELDKLKANPQAVLQNIDKAVKSHTITGRSGGSASKGKLTASAMNASQMSDAELDEILKKAGV